MLNNFLLLLPFLLLSLPCFGTSIFVFRTENTIYIGADSRRVLYIHNQKTNQIEEETSDTYCKIRTYGKFTFAVAGFDDSGMHAIAKSVCKTHTKPDLVFSELAIQLRSHLQSRVEQFKNQFPNKYLTRFTDKSLVGGIYMCFFDNKKPVILQLNFVLTQLSNGSIKIDIHPKQDIIFNSMGENNTIITQNIHEVQG